MAYISFQPQDYFNTKLYTGNNTSTSYTGIGFQPDWIWIKDRSQAADHTLIDAVRGVKKVIISNLTNAEGTDSSTQGLNSFDSDGFTLGTNSNVGSTNNTGDNYVAWNWKANGQGSSNADGSINTTYTSANTTSGFSIAQWTGTGSNATIGHGLGVAPSIVLCKNTSTTSNWEMYHSSIGAGGQITLNNTNAAGNDGNILWNSTAPTSSLFSVGTNVATNNSGSTMIAYCFAEKKGFSKFGSYTGNGNADGPFVYTGFKPAFVLWKQSSASGQFWNLFDNKRPTYNPMGYQLAPNSSNAESDLTSGTLYPFDLLSNGFKHRGSDANGNGSGATYIFMAFAESPLVSSNGIPAVAR